MVRAIAILAIASLIGCGGRSFDYNGDWQGNRNLNLPDQPASIAYTIGRVTLAIKDNRFQLTEAAIPSSGSIGYSGDGAELLVERRFDVPLERSGDAKLYERKIRIRPQADGSLLYEDPLAPDGKPVKLTRRR